MLGVSAEWQLIYLRFYFHEYLYGWEFATQPRKPA